MQDIILYIPTIATRGIAPFLTLFSSRYSVVTVDFTISVNTQLIFVCEWFVEEFYSSVFIEFNLVIAQIFTINNLYSSP